jgi:hypothetical protein
MSNDHAPLRLRDGKAGSDRGRHRLLDQRHSPRASGKGRLLDSVALDIGDAARNAEHNPREREAAADSADEITKHVRRHVEIGDHTMPQRADRPDRRGRTADHPLRVLSHRMDAAARLVDRYNRRLKDSNPLAAYEHERVRRAEIDCQLTATLETSLKHKPQTNVATASAGQPSRLVQPTGRSRSGTPGREVGS